MILNDLDILARTIYGEARGEYGRLEGGLASFIAVGNVVMNRVRAGHWYGKTIREVCHKPLQFSCWNQEDSNRNILLQEEIKDPLFLLCHEVARKVAAAQWPDLTKGSDHYHATTLRPYPPWTKGREPKIRFANHVFYQLSKGE